MDRRAELFERLFIFELANNHMGDLEHGLRTVREVHAAARSSGLRLAMKLQYRDLDTFIHPDPARREASRYARRFLETRLSDEQFRALRDEIKRLGMLAVCTPFDEASVDRVERHGYDILKIGSCSLTDWPLLERIAKTGLPVIASVGGASLDDIDKVASFLEHRGKSFALMHCVAEYPTRDASLQLGQIDLLRARYRGVPVGYSTHEDPANVSAVQMAVAKGAALFEKHVGVRTDRYPLNAYSATPEQAAAWLDAARRAYAACGVEGDRAPASEKERADLRGLQRGAFARRDIRKGERLSLGDVYLAIPNEPSQLVANEFSKYSEFTAAADIRKDAPVLSDQLARRHLRGKVRAAVEDVSRLLAKSGVPISDKLEMELSHHYGIDRFPECGAAILTLVNREYCKKLIILLPGQRHPAHRHHKKDETFHLLFGDLSAEVAGSPKRLRAGDILVIEREARHSFSSEAGAVIEEISTTHFPDDSSYEDEAISGNPARKTHLTFWADWLKDPGKIV